MGKSLEVDVFMRLAQAYRPCCPQLSSGNSAMDLEEVTLYYPFSDACLARSRLEQSQSREGRKETSWAPVPGAAHPELCVGGRRHTLCPPYLGGPVTILAVFSFRKGSARVENQESLGVPPASDLKGYWGTLCPCSQLATEGP